jgi:hypothetical protein
MEFKETIKYPYELTKIVETIDTLNYWIGRFKSEYPQEKQKTLKFHFVLQELQVALSKANPVLAGTPNVNSYLELVQKILSEAEKKRQMSMD